MKTNLENYIPEPTSGCWLWLGKVNKRGYGRVVRDGRDLYAHRAMYEQVRGAPIPHGLIIRHKCDVPCCVNPDHLLLGTHADNHRDMDERGRRVPPPWVPGERQGQSKLTADIVRAIRASDESHAALGRKYGVRTTTIFKVRRHESWAHIP